MLFRCPYHRPGENYFLELAQEKESESHVRLTSFITMIEPIVRLLKKVEGVKIPVYVPGADAGNDKDQNGDHPGGKHRDRKGITRAFDILFLCLKWFPSLFRNRYQH
jgi:hypothetical protein